jgi:MFS family permease
MLVSGAGANLASWALYAMRPVEYFVVGSAVGSAVGVWIARRSGWRHCWLFGAAIGALTDVAVFVVMTRVSPVSLVSWAEGA